MEFHEISNIFPLMVGSDLDRLAEDIKNNGLLEPILIFEGKVLDGRNRFKACELALKTPHYKTFNGSKLEAVSLVWSKNRERRHLNSGQAAMSEVMRERLHAEYATEVQRISDAAQERQKAAGEQYGKGHPKLREKIPQPYREQPHQTRASTIQAKAAGTNRKYLETAKKLADEKPMLAKKVLDGQIKMSDAIREIKREEIISNLENIKVKEVKTLQGVYDVIVIDPPWPMQKIERDERPNQSEFDYPTMSEEQLQGLKIPAADNCHVWVWTTQKFLPMAFRLVDYWGFKYACLFTWHKNGGFQVVGLPQFNCEFAIYCRKGSPQFIDTKSFFTCFNAPRHSHSEKPMEFYDVVKRVTAGRRLDMFSRRVIDGFEGWGLEA